MTIVSTNSIFESRHTDSCTICGQSSEYVGDGIMGSFGSMPVTFCQLCLESIVAMVRDISGEDDENMYI